MQRQQYFTKAHPWQLLLGLVFVLLPTLPAQAAEDPDMWQLCKPLDVIPLPAGDGQSLQGGRPPLHVSADKAISQANRDLKLQGDVRIRQGQQLLLADHIDYSQANNTAKADGNVILRNPNLQINSQKAEVNLKTSQGEYEHSHYQFIPRHATGEAKHMSSRDADHQKLEGVTYTTCDPDHVVWQLKARDMELDQAEKQGYAHDITLYFKKLPIFYFPYLRFPISDQRMSGFLFPNFFTIDNNTNSVISVPYYWNMAPNYDMTITPSIYTNHGVMLKDQFRYLTQRSHGNVDFEYLPDDRTTGTNRGRFSLNHSSDFASHWHTNAQLNYVSEASYYTDLGQNYDLIRNPYLRNSLQTSYSGSLWNFSGSVEAYQILTGQDQYQRMPQLTLGLKPAGSNRLNTVFNTEYDNFYSTDRTVHPIVGSRLDSTVGFRYPYNSAATFLTPSLLWHATQYQLQNRGTDTTSAPTREVPEFSLDSGVYLERSLANNRLIQTLEPRLYYLYVPYVDQSNLPVFDSSSYTFDFNQLFRDNRFSGADRIGDANQLTAAVTTRFLSANSGHELFNFSLGQIHYYAERQVNLDNPATSTPTPPQTAGSSDYVAQLGARISSHWNLTSTLMWDPVYNSATTSNNQLQYKSDRGHIFNLEYHSTTAAGTTTLAQTTASALWQFNPRWQVYGRENYDLFNQAPLDTILGFGYESCCWAIRITHRSYRPDLQATTPLKDMYMLEFEFKGLSSIGGGGTDAMLKSGILGYESKPR